MKTFKIRKVSFNSAEKCIKDVGFDKSYISKALDKYNFILIKIDDLSCPQASIIKQHALSFGADCAIHREVLTNKVEKTDVIIGGSISQLKKICEKLKHQPFKLQILSSEISEFLNQSLTPIKIDEKNFDWSKKTFVMGILNVTPDSFSDGGKFYGVNDAIDQFKQMVKEGADIIDIGGESTRPFADLVSVEEEVDRVIPIINKIRLFDKTTPISIDTRNSKTAELAIKAGANIINDVSGFDWDENMVNVAAKYQAPVIIMHSLSDPQSMQINPEYEKNIIDEIILKLRTRIQFAIDNGIKKENIIIDPGIGFGKTLEHNLEIIKRSEEFCSLGHPVLMGVSRKSVIAKILDVLPEEREEANISLASYMAEKGVNIFRVHDVKSHVKAFKVLDKVIKNI